MRPTPILQFGTSRFLQAHADLFISQAMGQGQDVGPITVVQSSGDTARSKRLAALADGYQVHIEGLHNGARTQSKVLVESVTRTLSTTSDWEEISRIFTHEAQIVLSNTGDSGFASKACDTATVFDQNMSYPAKLTLLLRQRFAQGAAPIQIMPMELIVDNGLVLKARVLELARIDESAFVRYLENDVIWVNSLVDRIVSQPLEPVGAIAEPYALWAIEDQPNLICPCDHPSVQVVPSLANTEALKLFVLNLGHTYLADRWLLRQEASVLMRDLMQTPSELAGLKGVLCDEVRPAFVAAGLEDAFDGYVSTTLDRFANPFLEHSIADIAQNHTKKVDRRIAAMLDWAQANGDVSAKPILSEIITRNKDATG